MKANNFISKKEHKLLLIVAFTALILSIVGSIAYSTKAENKRAAYSKEQDEKIARNEPVFSGAYCSPDKHPQFLFSIILLSALTFSCLWVAKRFLLCYLLSFLLTIASLSRFVYWYFDTQELFSSIGKDSVKGFDGFLYNAGDNDLVVLLLVSILLFWQIFILLRMLIKTLQRKTELP